MRVLSMWLMKKSRKVVSVSSSMKDECVSLPKPKSQLAQLHDDDENVFATSVIDRYAARPLALKDICLATFAVMYDVIQSSTQTEETDDMNTQQDMYNTDNPKTSTKIKLQKGLGIIRKRKKQAILHTRRYKIDTEPEKYYHAKLLLYYPWTQEDDLISTYENYQDSYMNKQHIIHQNAQKFNEDCEAFDINIQDLEHTIYHNLHGKWLLKILHMMIMQQMPQVSPQYKIKTYQKIPHMKRNKTTPNIQQIHYVYYMQKQQKSKI